MAQMKKPEPDAAGAAKRGAAERTGGTPGEARPAKGSKPDARTRAQMEFDRYRARMGASSGAGVPVGAPTMRFGFGDPPGAGGGFGAGGAAGPAEGYGPPGAYGPGGAFPPGWTFPWARGAGAGGSSGSLIEEIGTALRLGISALNAGLAGGLRMLGNLSDVAYGVGSYGSMPGGHGHEHWHGGCGCGCAGGWKCGCGCRCAGESLDSCCGYDCCCIMGADPCCRPSVGNCC